MTNHDYQLAKQANRCRLDRKIALFHRMQEQQQARIFAITVLGEDKTEVAFMPAEPTAVRNAWAASQIKTAA